VATQPADVTRHAAVVLCACALALALAGPVRAQVSEAQASDYSATARTASTSASESNQGATTVTRSSIDERLATSPPDALRYEAGVTIQQTAHGQASPFVRGLTGQQVVHLFDGIRLNNSLYRRGPNQYFFNLDTQTIAAIAVLRGSSSVLHGSDALGGAILVTPVSPAMEADHEGLSLHPELHLRLGTADVSGGARLALRGQVGADTVFLLGGGYFDAIELESAGQVHNDGRELPTVPRLARDGRTQLGTGYSEATFDARAVHRLTDSLQLTGALYGYRQYDAPRTDQCPRPGAEVGDCMMIEQQFRTLAYASLQGDAGTDARDLRATLSFQQGHERRRDTRLSAATEQLQVDDVTTWGITASAGTRSFALGDSTRLEFVYGGDAYLDQIGSTASTTDTATGAKDARSRGQYLTDSRYVTSGVYTDANLSLADDLELRAGVRGALSHAHAPDDPESGSRGIDRAFTALVARGGVTWNVATPVSLSLNVDQGFRAPNLDDLTSRQSVGAGFQIENPALTPEHALSTELGVRVTQEFVEIDAWVYWTALSNAILRASRDPSDCPSDTPQCMTAASQLTLVNADDNANILGAESRVTLKLMSSLSLRATFAYAYGEAPNTAAPSPEMPSPPARVALSRIPPMNGTVELRHQVAATGLYGAVAARWAAAQTRLAPTDATDPRFPPGGTPAYAVFELRAGYRFAEHLRLSIALDNIFDSAYRIHGSSVNGAARNLKVSLSAVW